MPDRLGGMNGPRHKQVLPEVFTLGGAAFFMAAVQTRHKRHLARVVLAEYGPVAQEHGQAAQRAQEALRVEAESTGEEPVELD